MCLWRTWRNLSRQTGPAIRNVAFEWITSNTCSPAPLAVRSKFGDCVRPWERGRRSTPPRSPIRWAFLPRMTFRYLGRWRPRRAPAGQLRRFTQPKRWMQLRPAHSICCDPKLVQLARLLSLFRPIWLPRPKPVSSPKSGPRPIRWGAIGRTATLASDEPWRQFINLIDRENYDRQTNRCDPSTLATPSPRQTAGETRPRRAPCDTRSGRVIWPICGFSTTAAWCG